MGRSSGGWASKSNVTESDAGEDDECVDELEMHGGQQRKLRKRATVHQLETGRDLRRKMLEFTWQAHWDSRTKARDFEKRVSGMRAQARRCSHHLTSEENQAVADELFQMADELENRQAVFVMLRVGFWDFAKRDMTAHERKIVEAAPLGTLGTIITSEMHKALDAGDFNADFFSMSSTQS